MLATTAGQPGSEDPYEFSLELSVHSGQISTFQVPVFLTVTAATVSAAWGQVDAATSSCTNMTTPSSSTTVIAGTVARRRESSRLFFRGRFPSRLGAVAVHEFRPAIASDRDGMRAAESLRTLRNPSESLPIAPNAFSFFPISIHLAHFTISANYFRELFCAHLANRFRSFLSAVKKNKSTRNSALLTTC